VVVSCPWRDSWRVGAELAQGLRDGAGRGKQLGGELAGQRPWPAECHRDVPGVHGGVQGTGPGRRRRREGALRERGRHRAVVAPDPRPRGAGGGERLLDKVVDAARKTAGGREGVLGRPGPDADRRRPGQLVASGVLEDLGDVPFAARGRRLAVGVTDQGGGVPQQVEGSR
jgi:hypothetical protein